MSLIPPRMGIPVSDESGLMTAEWYKFLVMLAKSVGPSLTTQDDLATQATTDAAFSESIALGALKASADALSIHLLTEYDKPSPVDTSLLGWWPGDIK